MEQKESKNIKDILNSIGESSSFVAKTMCLAMLTGITALAITFPGESIKVGKNSTLSGIAQEYETTWPRLEKRNKLENPNYIQAGQDLIIYPEGSFGFFQKAYDIIDKYWF